MSDHLRTARGLALGVPLALLAGAYVSQYGFGLFPCEMCWWQRYALIAALPFAVLAFVPPRRAWPVALAAVAILASGLIGGFHAGVEYGWWEGLTACTMNAEAGSDPLASILAAPLVRCDVAPWTLAGISLAGFNFAFSTAAAMAIFALLPRSSRRNGHASI